MMVSDSLTPALQALQEQFDGMPPVAAMRIRVDGLHGGGLCLRAPLDANVNDKANAFGGSLASLMTLAAWGWLTLHLRQAGHVADVYVADSQLRYLAPVYEELVALAAPEADADLETFLATFRQRGKARLSLQAEVRLGDGSVAASLVGRFVAIAKAG